MEHTCNKEAIIDKMDREIGLIWSKVSKLNGGNVKWWQIATVTITMFGIFTSVSLWAAKEVISVDLRAMNNYKENRDRIMDMKEDIIEVKVMLSYLVGEARDDKARRFKRSESAGDSR